MAHPLAVDSLARKGAESRTASNNSEESGVHQFSLRPNCSLSNRSAAVFFATMTATSMTIALGFAAAGYWPILPFAGLELAALGGALYWSMRQGHKRELICVDETTVSVQKTGPASHSRIEFARPWTRVMLEPARSRNWPSRLLLMSMGRSVEVGAFLTDHERRGLKKRLVEVIDSKQPGPA